MLLQELASAWELFSWSAGKDFDDVRRGLPFEYWVLWGVDLHFEYCETRVWCVIMHFVCNTGHSQGVDPARGKLAASSASKENFANIVNNIHRPHVYKYFFNINIKIICHYIYFEIICSNFISARKFDGNSINLSNQW